ncbi:MAG: hypothetical protein JSU63_11740, partial [Phycisphaerales bacterium]
MRKHRKLMFAGAGSAIAATIVIVASLLISTPGVTVEAATIFASFREAMGNAFTISFENIGDDEGRMNGEVVVFYGDQTEESADDDSSSEGAAEDTEYVSGAYFQMHMQVDQDASQLAGLDCEAEGAFFSDNMWIYAKAGNIPADILSQNPILGAYVSGFSEGVLLELGNIVDWAQNQDWEALAPAIAGVQHAALDEEDLAELQQLANVDWSAVTAQSGAAVGEGMGDMWGGAHPIIIGGDHVQVSSNAEINTLLNDLLKGEAGADDFERLAALIEESAGNVTVTPQGDGSYLLRATDFSFESVGLDADELALVTDMSLQIAYAEDAGMLWATIDHLGAYDGVVRFEHADIDVDNPMF